MFWHRSAILGDFWNKGISAYHVNPGTGKIKNIKIHKET
jgi:hypothetical protein